MQDLRDSRDCPPSLPAPNAATNGAVVSDESLSQDVLREIRRKRARKRLVAKGGQVINITIVLYFAKTYKIAIQ